jgi:ribonuclease HI
MAVLVDPEEVFLSLLAVRTDHSEEPPDGGVEPANIASLSQLRKAPFVADARARLSGVMEAVAHCDGCCSPNPGPGGWGLMVDSSIPRIELCGADRQTTNNRMEITAALVALIVLPPTCTTTIISDSQYLIKGASLWITGWKRKGFQRGGEPIPNADLWRDMDALTAGRSLTWRWVRGHSGHDGNERADALATRGARRA